LSANSLPRPLRDKLDRARARIRSLEGVLVAFSGGVDSTLVLALARDELGPRAVALTAVSASLPREEREAARDLARRLGAEQIEVASDELSIEGYARNPTDRCYFCKDHLYRLCHREAERRGLVAVIDGVNADDLSDHRPGLRAAHEQAVCHPLAEADLGKEEVRRLSAWRGLPTWDKPASPCLASRFAYGLRITPERLGRVERAESALRRLGFRDLRVRFEGETARLEIPLDLLPLCTQPATREAIVADVKRAGFRRVVLDLEGFRSGSLNEALGADPDRPG